MSDQSATANVLANALGAIADLGLGESDAPFTQQVGEVIPILNALGFTEVADQLRRVTAGSDTSLWAILSDTESELTSARADLARTEEAARAVTAERDHLGQALRQSEAEVRHLELELVDINRQLHGLVGRPWKMDGLVPLKVALVELGTKVKNLEKQRRRNQRKAQMTLARLAEAEGRKPKPGDLHPEAAIHAAAVAAGQDRATRKAAALRRRDPSSGVGRLMLLAGWFQVERP